MTRDHLPGEVPSSGGGTRAETWDTAITFLSRTMNLAARRGRGLRKVCERECCRRYISSRLTNFGKGPDIESHEGHRGSIGGWCLGNPHEEDATKEHIAEDEDDELDRDQAQSVGENGHGEGGDASIFALLITGVVDCALLLFFEAIPLAFIGLLEFFIGRSAQPE